MTELPRETDIEVYLTELMLIAEGDEVFVYSETKRNGGIEVTVFMKIPVHLYHVYENFSGQKKEYSYPTKGWKPNMRYDVELPPGTLREEWPKRVFEQIFTDLEEGGDFVGIWIGERR